MLYYRKNNKKKILFKKTLIFIFLSNIISKIPYKSSYLNILTSFSIYLFKNLLIKINKIII